MEHVLSQFFHIVGVIMFCSAITILLLGFDLSNSMQQDLMKLNQKEVIEEGISVLDGLDGSDKIVTYAELLTIVDKIPTYKIEIDSMMVEHEDDAGLHALLTNLLAESPNTKYEKSYCYDAFGVIEYISYRKIVGSGIAK